MNGYTAYTLTDSPVASLTRSSNFIDQARVDQLATKVELDGKGIDPILIDESTNEIINGNHRLEAFKLRGILTIPVILCLKT